MTQSGQRAQWLRSLRRHPSMLLLLAQLLMVLLYPFAEDLRTAHILLGVFGVVILLLALRLVRFTSGQIWLAAPLALTAVIFNGVYIGLDLEVLLPWQAGMEAAFYFYAVWCLIRYMLADQRATTDELYAASATFTLLVWAFTYVYVLCQALQPGAFAGAADDLPRSWTELMFLSFALMSSTGIGEVVPATSQARAIADLEMFTGVMYVAFVVSRLIGLVVTQKKR